MLIVLWTTHRIKRVDLLEPRLPARPARLGGGVQPRARRERRAEDDGRDPRPADRGGQSRDPTADVPLWARALRAHSHRARHAHRRMAHREDDGVEDHAPRSRWAACAPRRARRSSLFFTSAQGIPVSTTHTITGGIVGVGSVRRISAVRWGVARRVVWAWVFTIPGAALVAAADLRTHLGGLMDRRAVFFLVASVICAALTFALDELQWVTIALGRSCTRSSQCCHGSTGWGGEGADRAPRVNAVARSDSRRRAPSRCATDSQDRPRSSTAAASRARRASWCRRSSSGPRSGRSTRRASAPAPR